MADGSELLRYSMWCTPDGRPAPEMAIIDERDQRGKKILRQARAAAVLRHSRAAAADKEVAIRKLADLLEGCTPEELAALSRVWMISDKWNGATGQGGIWAVASELVNRLASDRLRDVGP